jgi:hypothetical protein
MLFLRGDFLLRVAFFGGGIAFAFFLGAFFPKVFLTLADGFFLAFLGVMLAIYLSGTGFSLFAFDVCVLGKVQNQTG